MIIYQQYHCPKWCKGKRPPSSLSYSGNHYPLHLEYNIPQLPPINDNILYRSSNKVILKL